jgi:predicted PurR-regulated permease PerM
MIATRQLRFWLIGLLLGLVGLYLLRNILLPFVAGLAIAYMLDPVCDWLERRGFSRPAATVIISACIVVVLVVALVFLLPLVEQQIVDFAGRLPGFVEALANRLLPTLASFGEQLGITNLSDLSSSAGSHAAGILGWIGGAVAGLLGRGMAIANLLSLLFITPVVAFYLLRDWDRLVREIDSLLPQRHAETIRQQLKSIDRTLAGFARGQATVCLLLAIFYAAGLSLIGVNFGFAIGLGIGFLSFIPYVGSITGFIVSVGVALAQFGGWTHVGLVVALFALGQLLEGYVLTPRLVGGRVGLHPVWVIFALLAGGALFGFVGLLLAVPTAAAIGVLVRFGTEKYRQSNYFRGDPPWPNSPST